MTIVNPDADLLIITAHGMGKRSRLGHGVADLDQHISGGGYRLTRRGSKGVISIRLREGDHVVQALLLDEDVDIIMTSVKGQLVRIETHELRTMGRSTQGVRIMRLREDDEISVVTKVAALPGEDDADVEIDAPEIGAVDAMDGAGADTVEDADGFEDVDDEIDEDVDADEIDEDVDDMEDDS